jgi:hydroxyacylglutathione hydrolase
MLKVFSIPILKDNYVHVIVDQDSRNCLIIDPGVAGPVIDFITTYRLKPQAVLLTHHHGDHTGGTEEIRDFFRDVGGPVIYAPVRERADIPFADRYLLPGDVLKILGLELQILGLPGHTHGHIAFYEATQGWLFSGDVLFSLGCGRIFEGTFEEQFCSLQTLKALPPQTTVYCTHEYTWMNAQFCLTQTAHAASAPTVPLQRFAAHVQELRAAGQPTVPFSLQQELELNPFLRARTLQEFTSLREARNYF